MNILVKSLKVFKYNSVKEDNIGISTSILYTFQIKKKPQNRACIEKIIRPLTWASSSYKNGSIKVINGSMDDLFWISIDILDDLSNDQRSKMYKSHI